MFDVHTDAWYVWLGLGAVSLAVAGTAVALPSVAPPDATPVAETVDEVASTAGDGRATVEISADRVRIRPHSVALRNDGGTAHAQVLYGPITPARGDKLREVLRGARPPSVFESQHAFATALARARAGPHEWVSAPNSLTVRGVSWGGLNATLVG